MAGNFLLKKDEQQLLILKTHEPLIVSLLYTDWKDENKLFSPFSKKSDFGVMECSFIGANNNIESFSFSEPIPVAKSEFDEKSVNILKRFESKEGYWFITNENDFNSTLQDENLSHYLLESGLAEIFGKDFYEKVQDDLLSYRDSQIEEYECRRSR